MDGKANCATVIAHDLPESTHGDSLSDPKSYIGNGSPKHKKESEDASPDPTQNSLHVKYDTLLDDPSY